MKTSIPQIFQGWRVVVVDDEEDSQIVAAMMLEMAGAEVLTANNGREGLSVIRNNRPHLVISDLSMPELDGWGMMRELNMDRTTMDIPVVALTAHAMVGDRERAIQAGFTNYISKPLDPEKFLNQLAALVAAVPSLRDMIQA
ncbi:MAG TPA: response regulator [Aggregatilineales bacterium]|nr:response regulator [Anaerolineae bacterium]HUN10010.1 response regulator [Aggregatilineales bacterium]